MGHQSAFEANVREDDVLDALAHECLAASGDLDWIRVGELEQDRDVVRAEAPESVLIGAKLAQVETLRVDVADLAELTAGDQVGELPDAGVVAEEVADHQDQAALLGDIGEPLGRGHVLGERFLHEAVLAGFQDALGDGRMRRARRRDHDRAEVGIVEQIVEIRREAGLRVGGLHMRALRVVELAAPGELAALERGEVAGEIRPPVPHADYADA